VPAGELETELQAPPEEVPAGESEAEAELETEFQAPREAPPAPAPEVPAPAAPSAPLAPPAPATPPDRPVSLPRTGSGNWPTEVALLQLAVSTGAAVIGIRLKRWWAQRVRG
jgi:hypothetical protein